MRANVIELGVATLACEAAWQGAAWRGVAQRGVAWRGVAWRGVAWRGVAWHGMEWQGGLLDMTLACLSLSQHSMAWCYVTWYDMP
jgi:hypothetical protein